jgi:CheY-like chemotaxis protein
MMVAAVIVTLGAFLVAVGLVLRGVPRWESARWVPWVGLGAALVAVSDLTAAWVEAPELVAVARRAELLAGALFLSAFLEHVHRALGRAAPSALERLGAAVLVAAALAFQLVGAGGAAQGNPATLPAPPWTLLGGALAASLLLGLLGRLLRAAVRGRGALPQLVGVVALLVAGLVELVDRSLAPVSTPRSLDGLLPAALLLPLLVEAVAFLRQVAEDARHLGALTERLVENAETRTTELAFAQDDLADARRQGAAGRLAVTVAREVQEPAAVARDNLRHVRDRLDDDGVVTAWPGARDARLALLDAEAALERITRAVDRMRTVGEVADRPREPTAPDLLVRDVVGRALRRLPRLDGYGPIRLEVDIDPELRVVAAPEALERVLRSVFEWGVRAIEDRGGPAMGGTLRVRAEASKAMGSETDPDEVGIIVLDDGAPVGPVPAPADGRAAPPAPDPSSTASLAGELGDAPGDLDVELAQGLLREMGGRLELVPRGDGINRVRLVLPAGFAPGTVASTGSSVWPSASGSAPAPPHGDRRDPGAPTVGATGGEPPGPWPAPLAPHRPRLLLVDDDPLVRRALARRLARSFEVESAGSVDDARSRLLRAPPPDLVLCDVMMEGGGGPGLFEHVQRERPALADRFVFVTGGATDRQARLFLARTPRPVLSKPLDVPELLRLARGAAPTSPRHVAPAGPAAV